MINNSNFIVSEIPELNPISDKYERIDWWREQKRLCMEGMWVGGKWMPGPLYFYVNFWNIEVEGGKGNVGKIFSRPWLRDLEWEKIYIYMEAKGFSGFTDDPLYTCNEAFGPKKEFIEKFGLYDAYVRAGYIRPEDAGKTYVNPREYLNKIHAGNMGKPLFQNEAQNIIDMECKGGGKSYMATAMIGHNFVFDGGYDYDAYLKARDSKNPFKSQTLVGAIDTAYSRDLIGKFLISMEEKNFVGAQIWDGEFYPSPLYTPYKGSIAKAGGFIQTLHSGSLVHHRAFKDDPTAGAGTRPSLVILEEIGFFDTIKDTIAALNGTINEGTRQLGVIWGFGTGGLNKGLAAIHAKDIFYNPEQYRCLAFPDIYEGRGTGGKIGYFVPAHKTRNHFKEGENLITNVEAAKAFEIETRESKKKDKQAYAGYVVNYPEVPSEVFYSVEGSFFPVAELKAAEAELLSDERRLNSSWKGFCKQTSEGVVWENTNDQPIREFPYQASKMGEGCIEIFEPPVPDAGFGFYIAGIDPIDDDDYAGSLLSTFIMNRLTRRIVAEYTARHAQVKTYYENVRLLLMYYNAVANYEAQKKGLYQHFEIKDSLHLLAETPKILQDKDLIKKINGLGNRAYGTTASAGVNRFGRDKAKEWMLEEAYGAKDKINIDTIRSPALFKELLLWNDEANFDRVSAMIMLMILDREYARIVVKEEKKEDTKSFSSELKKIANIKFKPRHA